MDHEASGVAKIGDVAEELERIHEFHAGLITALERDGEEPARALGADLRDARVIRRGGQAGIGHAFDGACPSSQPATFSAFSTCFFMRSDSVSIPISV